jgi:hypothetical protein
VQALITKTDLGKYIPFVKNESFILTIFMTRQQSESTRAILSLPVKTG